MIQKYLSIRNLTWAYFVLFVLLVGMNFMPFIYADNGMVFGFFKLEPEGNILHVISAIWAFCAALAGRKAGLFYFRVFGTAYFLDGVIGVLFGKAYLNLHLFNAAIEPTEPFFTRLVVDAPHLIIGGSAMIIGYYLYKKIR